MRIWDIVVMANRNLMRSKLRTLLTVLAIFVGGFTLTMTTALNTGATEYLDRQLGNVSVPGVFQVLPKTDVNPFLTDEVREYDPDRRQSGINEILNSSMKQADVDKLAAVEGVERAEAFYSVSADYVTREDQKKYQAPQIMQDIDLNLDLAEGQLIGSQANVVVLPDSLVSPLGFADAADAVGKEITIGYKDARGQIREKQASVSGVMKKTFVTSGQMFVSYDVAEEIAQSQGQSGSFLAVFVKFKDANDQTDESALKQRLQDAGNYTAMSQKERIGTVITIVSAITAGLSVVGIIALVAASFGIINTLLMSVYERTKEVGLMKALGMHRRTVFSVFAIEAALVGFWGSLVAVLAATTASVAVNSFASSTFLKDFEGFTLLVVNPAGAAFVMGLIMLIAFLAGTLPAIKASRLDPIEALRSE